MEANTKEDSVKMNEYEGLTEMLVEMASEEVGASMGPGLVVVLDGSGKVMVGTDKESEMELERGTTTEVGSGGADEEGTVGTGGASEEEGGGMMLDKVELTVLIISPGFSLRRYIYISILGFSPLYMINVYGTNPTTQKTE